VVLGELESVDEVVETSDRFVADDKTLVGPQIETRILIRGWGMAIKC
jgi:hypothetical protein